MLLKDNLHRLPSILVYLYRLQLIWLLSPLIDDLIISDTYPISRSISISIYGDDYI